MVHIQGCFKVAWFLNLYGEFIKMSSYIKQKRIQIVELFYQTTPFMKNVYGKYVRST